MQSLKRAHLTMALGCIATITMLSGCAQTVTEKRVETTSTNPGDAVVTGETTEKVTTDLNGDTHVETTTVETEPASGGIVTHGGDVVKIDTDRIDEDTSRRVREPLVRVKTDEAAGSVHIKVPFVKIDKDGAGQKTRIKLPGIRINTDD